MQILFVCTGNTCRSPMAEAIARAQMAEVGLAATVWSAGIRAEDGAPASPENAAALEALGIGELGIGKLGIGAHGIEAHGIEAHGIGAHGIGAQPHRARQLTAAMVAASDVVFVMTDEHRAAVLAIAPEAANVQLLDPAGDDVPDPIGHPQSVYDETAVVLHRLVALRLGADGGGLRRWQDIESELTGGHPNSLGQTVEVAERVLADETQTQMQLLCDCYSSTDDVVRLRVSSALKRVAGLHPESMSGHHPARPEWLVERFDWLIDDIGRGLDQASAKWSIAQILARVDPLLDAAQRSRGIELLKHNLDTDNDWIVLCTTAQVLADLAEVHHDTSLATWLLPRLERMTADDRKSVAGKARKLLDRMSKL